MKTYEEIIQNIQIIYPRLYYLCKVELLERYWIDDIYKEGLALPFSLYEDDEPHIVDCISKMRKHFKFKESNMKVFEDIQRQVADEIQCIWFRDHEKIRAKEVQDVRIRRLT